MYLKLILHLTLPQLLLSLISTCYEAPCYYYFLLLLPLLCLMIVVFRLITMYLMLLFCFNSTCNVASCCYYHHHPFLSRFTCCSCTWDAIFDWFICPQMVTLLAGVNWLKRKEKKKDKVCTCIVLLITS